MDRVEEGEEGEGKEGGGEEKKVMRGKEEGDQEEGGLMDLISGFGAEGEEGEGVLTEAGRKKGSGEGR